MNTDTHQQTKHTPGPWRASDGAFATDHTPDRFEVMAGQHGEKLIAQVFYGQSMGEMEVNARLIAAAPDLLTALRRALPLIEWHEGRSDRHDEIIDAAYAAIEKAEVRA